MPKVRMLAAMAGSVSLKAGDEHDFDDATAARLIERGLAVAVEAAKPKKRSKAATAKKPEPANAAQE